MGLATGGSGKGFTGLETMPILGPMFAAANKANASIFSKFPLIGGLFGKKPSTPPTLGQSDPSQNKFTSMLGG